MSGLQPYYSPVAHLQLPVRTSWPSRNLWPQQRGHRGHTAATISSRNSVLKCAEVCNYQLQNMIRFRQSGHQILSYFLSRSTNLLCSLYTVPTSSCGKQEVGLHLFSFLFDYTKYWFKPEQKNVHNTKIQWLSSSTTGKLKYLEFTDDCISSQGARVTNLDRKTLSGSYQGSC